MIKESMYKAGIVAEPTPIDFTLFYKNAMDHNFEAMLGGWEAVHLIQTLCNYGTHPHGLQKVLIFVALEMLKAMH